MNVLIIEDHPLVGLGIKVSIEGEFKGSNVILYSTVDRGLNYCKKNTPDIIILDMHLNGETGLDFIKGLDRIDSSINIIVLTASDLTFEFDKLVSKGVNAVVNKGSIPETLFCAIKTVISGKKFYDSVYLSKLYQSNINLTDREFQVFQLIGKGFDNYEISRKLFISQNTVKKHITNIMSKLEMTNRVQIALMAYSKYEHDLVGI